MEKLQKWIAWRLPRWLAYQCAVRVLIHGTPAIFTLIAERLVAAAMRAGATYEAVRQELPGLHIVELPGCSLGEQSLLVNL